MSDNTNNFNENTQSEQNATNANEQTGTNEYGYSSSDNQSGDYNYTQYQASAPQPIKELPPENTVAGTVGAFLFALAGGILYFIIYQLGYIAGICGLLTVVCAIKGYAIFGKRESVKGIVIAVVLSVVVLILAEYVSLSYVLYDTINEMFEAGEIDYTITMIEAVGGTFDFILENPDLLPEVIKDIAIMLVLSAIGAFSSIRNAILAAKANKQ